MASPREDLSNRRTIGYVRVSTSEQAREGVSLEAQEKRIRDFCSYFELTLVDIIREEGVSATLPLGKRPGGQRLLAAIKSAHAGHVVALKLDRLFRNASDALQQTKAWEASGITWHLADMGGQPLNGQSAVSRMLLTVMSGFAEFERNLIAERTTAALAYKRSQGQVVGEIPYGYDRIPDTKQLIPNANEQAVISYINKRYAAGVSLNKIAIELTKRGVPTKWGSKKWYPQQIKRLIGRTENYSTGD